VNQCAPVGFTAGSACDAPGNKLRMCTTFCADDKGEASYSYSATCTCAL
jgi:hypothetical protein